MSIEDSKTYINQLGREMTPFFFMIDFDLQKPIVIPLGEMSADILYDINGITNYNSYSAKDTSIEFKCIPYPIEKYEDQFDEVVRELNYGNSFLLNLAARHEFVTDASLKEIFLIAKAKYKLYFKGQFVVFSPETFIQIKKNLISSYPMKGTIDASIDNAEAIILSDPKEKAEHNTIVDLIRNDLSIVAKNVKVQRFRYIDKIKSRKGELLQVSSEVAGRLPQDYHNNLGDILYKLLPAGSICGAPKQKTVEIINRVEQYPRSYYTGIGGIYNGDSLDSFVMIRYIERENDKLYYRSGGGITAMSKMQDEYDEMIKKVYVPTS